MSVAVPLPRLTAESAFFWTAGETGTLLLQRCRACQRFTHPPVPQCRSCGSSDVAPTPVSGRGVLWTATTSHQQLLPQIEVPYTVAIVELAEQSDLHLTTRLVGIPPDEVRIGMPLAVRFERHGEIYLPLFGPVPA